MNISSVHGLRASAYKSAYVTAKHALEGLSKVTALEGGPHGVTSNCVNPGYVRTPLVEKQIADQARTHGIDGVRGGGKIMLDPQRDQAAGRARGGRVAGRLAGRSGCGHGHRSLLHHGRRMDGAVSSSYRPISATVEGGRLHGGEWNPTGATTVVAVHGITANHRNFALLAEALPRHRLLAPDLRGRGASRTLPGPWGIDRHAEDVARLITASGRAPVVLLGHSMGGFVTTALVRKFPDLVSGLLLVDGGLPFPLPQGIERRSGRRTDPGSGPAAIAENVPQPRRLPAILASPSCAARGLERRDG